MSNTYKSKYYMSEVESILDSVKSKADKEYVDEQIAEAETIAKNYTDTKASAAEGNAKQYADGKAGAALTSAKDYADTKAETAEGNAKAYADSEAQAAEKSAKEYADSIKPTKVSQLENDSGYLTSANAVGKKGTGEGAEIFNLYGTEGIGISNDAQGQYSHAEGYDTRAQGDYSHSEGNGSQANGENSHAEGSSCAEGKYSHSEGQSNQAYGENSHAEGYKTYAYSNSTHSEGLQSTSGALGFKIASGTGTEGEAGSYVIDISDENASYALGDNKNQSDYIRTLVIQNYGFWYAYAIIAGTSNEIGKKINITKGYKDITGKTAYLLTSEAGVPGAQIISSDKIGVGAHAEGNSTYASGEHSHAEGYKSQASGQGSHAEGHYSQAFGSYSHAENQSTASGDYSHAEGMTCNSKGYASHSEGLETEAIGMGAHSEGLVTIANGEGQHVQGKYNIKDTESKYAHILGNGTFPDDADDPIYSNAHTIDWSGNAWFAGGLKVGGSGQYDGAAKDVATVEQVTAKANEAETAAKNYTDTKLKGKADRYVISASVTGNTLLLADKSDTQLLSAVSAALTLTLPETVTSGYECFFSFKSGATATTLTVPSGITWTGADCNSDKEFVPLANTVYEVGIRCIGFASDGTPYLSARVGAC